MKSVTFPNGPITMAGNLYLPVGFDDAGSYPAIVAVHPGGGVKEQTAGHYAAQLARQGFVTLAFDASTQGESGGETRFVEDPFARVNDVRAAVDYLTTLGFVDTDRIGAFGVCAGGGYAATATMSDRRIKALATVSAVNLGDMFRKGWDGSADPAQSIGLAGMGSDQRSTEASGGAAAFLDFAPRSLEGVDDPDMREAYDYYRTPRAQHPNTPSKFTTSSLPQIVTFDAFHLADVLLTQPVLAIAGSKAGSRWFSEDLIARAASTDKTLRIIEGGTHMGLYDQPDMMRAAMSELTPFFTTNLRA